MYIKEYQIGSQIHEDVIGQIYIANTTDLERAVFFKILHQRFLDHPELVQAFHDCADILGNFENENQVQMIEHGEENGRHYIIFEYFNLAPLERILLKKSVLSLSDASNVIEKIAAILRNYHLEGFIHGGLTPQNIFIDDEFTVVKIGDFGFHHFIHLLIKQKERTLAAVLPYYSPELTSQSTNLDRRSDIYSLGVLYYRMITGLLPWGESTPDELDGARRPLSLIPPSLRRLEVPDYLDNLILKMLEPDLEKRFQNLSQFIKHFAHAKAQIIASITPVTPQGVHEYPSDKSHAFSEESVSEEKLNIGRSNDQPDRSEKKVAAANAPPLAAFDDDSFRTPADDTLESEVVQPSKAAIFDEQVPVSGTPKTSEARPLVDHLPKSLSEKVSSPPLPSDTKPNNGASKVEKGSPQKVTIPSAKQVKPPVKVSTIKKQSKPAPAFVQGQEATATQTEEFATTQAINLQSQIRGLSFASLFKFVFLPISILLVLYISISFLDLELTADWPNFKNSILFQKIQKVLQSKNNVGSSPNQVREIHKGSKSGDAAPAEPSQTDQAEIRSPNSALDSGINSTRTGNGAEANSSKASPKSAASDRVTLKMLVKSGSTPLSAEVYIDGRFLGKTTSQGQMMISNLALETSYLIQIKNREFQTWANQVSFNKAGTVNLNIELTALANGKTASVQPANKQKTGTVTVLLSNPLHLSNAFVYINGQLWGGPEKVAPAKVALAPGRYIIEVKKNGFRCQPSSQTVEVAAGKNTTVKFLLVPN